MVRKGLPKSIIKKYGISKKAWRVFRGRKKSGSRKVTRKRNNPKRRTRKLGRRKRRRRGKNIAGTVEKFLKIGALVAPAGVVATQPLAPDQKLNEIIRLYTGVNIKWSMESNDFKFDWRRLAMGWGPFAMANLIPAAIHKINGIIRRI